MAGKGAIRDARSRCLTIPACADIHVPDSRVRGNDARRGSSGECHTRGSSARVEGSKDFQQRDMGRISEKVPGLSFAIPTVRCVIPIANRDTAICAGT